MDHEEDETKVNSTTGDGDENADVKAGTTSRAQQLQLDSLLADYKATIRDLEQEVETLGGDPSSLGRGRTLEQLHEELESLQSAKTAAEKGTVSFSSFPFSLTYAPLFRLQPCTKQKRPAKRTSTRLRRLSRRSSSCAARLGAGDTSPLACAFYPCVITLPSNGST